MSDIQVICRLRELRQARGRSQAELASATGLTRQAIGAIESGAYLPNTGVAIRLAKCLGCRVEDIFTDGQDDAAVPVQVAGAASPGQRLAVARIRDRLVGHPLSGHLAVPEAFTPADGLLEPAGPDARVRLLMPEAHLDRTALLLGCDPAFALLARHVERGTDARLATLFAPSGRALHAVDQGEAHIAGSHLFDPVRGQADTDAPRAALGAGGVVVTFATWEQGLMVAAGNPRGLRGVADLAGARLINREAGSGSRRLLDSLLTAAGVPTTAISGYERCAHSHLDAARAVASGAADAGIGLRAVAGSQGLDFIPLCVVRCDLVIPRDHLGHPGVVATLHTLHSRAFRAELAALPGYDTTATGTTVLDLPAAA